MRFGRACSTAYAVAPGASAEKDDHISRLRSLSADICLRSRCYDCADLHSLGGIARMVQFTDDAGGKADLVAIGGISRGSCCDELALGEFAGYRFTHGHRRIRSACHSHSAVYIGSAGKRIPDGTAYAGCSAAKGFYLSGMVVRLILEEQEPGFGFAVNFNVYLHRAGIDLLAFIKLIEHAGGTKMLYGNRCQIHQRYRLFPSKLCADRKVVLPGLLQQCILELHIVYHRIEGGVAAVIGPVCIQHADLGYGRVPLFRTKVFLAEYRVIHVHSQTHIRRQLFDAAPVKADEALQCLHPLRHCIICLQR